MQAAAEACEQSVISMQIVTARTAVLEILELSIAMT